MVAAGFVRIIVMNISNYEKFTQYVPGFIWDSSFTDAKNLLKVEIKDIKFSLHRLSSEEFFLFRKTKEFV